MVRPILTGLAFVIMSEFALVEGVFAQEDTVSRKPIRLVLKDGSELIGTILDEDSVSVAFVTAGLVAMTIPKNQVKVRENLAGDIVSGQYRRRDPNDTRLLFAPTGRTLSEGQGYLSDYELFFPFVGFGVTDYLTLAGGISLFPTGSAQLFYVAPKLRVVHLRDFDFSAGVLYLNSTVVDISGAGIWYGVATYGDGDAAVTGGLGWGFAGSQTAKNPVLILGGELRLSNSVKLITENWFPPHSDTQFLSLGLRFFGESVSADIALVFPAGSTHETTTWLPWAGFAYNFGTTK